MFSTGPHSSIISLMGFPLLSGHYACLSSGAFPLTSACSGRQTLHPDSRGDFVIQSAHTAIRQNIHLFIPAISIAPLQVLYYSEALPTTVRILYRSFTPKNRV